MSSSVPGAEGNVIRLRQICHFLVGADAHIGPKRTGIKCNGNRVTFPGNSNNY